MTNEVLAFDWGTTVIGILDVNNNAYTAYLHGEQMVEGASRIILSQGTIVSFNGKGRDLIEIARMLDFPSVSEMNISAKHDDMMEITSYIRWPPVPGSASICGPGLRETFRHYFGAMNHLPPTHLQDDYIVDNWRDCCMTAELWKKWKSGELSG